MLLCHHSCVVSKFPIMYYRHVLPPTCSALVFCPPLVELLQELSLDLSNGVESLQSAVSYILIFLLEGQDNVHTSLPAPILHQWNCGVIKMLTKAEKLTVQVNALGTVTFEYQ